MLGQPWWQQAHHHEDPPGPGQTVWTLFLRCLLALPCQAHDHKAPGPMEVFNRRRRRRSCPLCLRIDGLFLRGKQRGSIRRALAVNVSPQRLKRSVSLNVVKHLYLGRNGVHDRAGKNTSIAIHHVSKDLDTFRFCRKDRHKYIHIRDGSCFGSPLPASSYI